MLRVAAPRHFLGRRARSTICLTWRQRVRSGWSRARKIQRAAANFFEYLAVLFIEAQLERGFAIGIERQEVVIIVGAAMQHAAAAIDGGIDQRVGDTGVLGLHVIRGLAETNIGVMTEDHGDGPRVLRTVQKVRQIRL